MPCWRQDTKLALLCPQLHSASFQLSRSGKPALMTSAAMQPSWLQRGQESAGFSRRLKVGIPNADQPWSSHCVGLPVALCVQWHGPRCPTSYLFYPGREARGQESQKTLAYLGCQELGLPLALIPSCTQTEPAGLYVQNKMMRCA